MSVGMNTDSHHATGASATSGHGQSVPSIPGLPNVNDGAPRYIDGLLSPVLGSAEHSNGDFFSSLDGESHHGEEQKSTTNTVVKWGIGLLAAAVLWKAGLNQKVGDLIRSTATKMRNAKKTASTD